MSRAVSAGVDRHSERPALAVTRAVPLAAGEIGDSDRAAGRTVAAPHTSAGIPTTWPGAPPRLARGAALVAFYPAHLALVALAMSVFSNAWLDPLERATRGLVTSTLVVNLVGLAIVGGGVVLGLGRLRPEDVGLRRSDAGRALALLLALWLAALAAALARAWVGQGEPAPNPQWARRGILAVLGLLLAQLLGNALLEELGFRGFLMSQLRLRLAWVPGPRRRLAAAVAVSQGLFALMHVPNRLREGAAGFELVGSVAVAFALGVLLAALYLRTGNLLLVVGIHSLMNAPTLLVESRFSHEIVEGLAALLLLVWPRLTWLTRSAGQAPIIWR